MVSLRDFLYPPITLNRFANLRALSPKRICFGSTHRTALKRVPGGSAVGFLNVPFSESFGQIFPWRIFENKKGKFGGYYRKIDSERDYAQISEWLSERSELVFIRSLFKTAIAVSEHYSDQGRTRIGELEKAAKYDANLDARRQLVDELVAVVESNLRGLGIDALVSVPSSDPAALSLPNFLASRLSDRVGLQDLTSAVRWAGPKGEIKALNVEQKWEALAAVGLNVDGTVAGKSLLVIDDMYQSGATAHFVASRLREAGANDLHLLCVSKGRRDTDNQ